MSKHSRAFAALTASIAAVSLAACGGTTQTALPLSAHSASTTAGGRVSAGTAKVFVSNNAGNSIEIYPAGVANPSPLGSITNGISGPDGTAVDAHGTLYVTNASGNTITEYPAGATSPSVTISNGLNFPTAIAVSNDGTIAVSEFPQQAIVEYKPGATTPAFTMMLLTYPEGLTWDSKGNLWAAWNESGGSGLSGHVSKCEHLQAVCLDQGIAAGQSGGIALDSKGDIILADQTNSVINVYAPGKTTPMKTISTAGHDPAKLALNASETRLYVADIAGSAVVTYAYPSGKPGFTITNGLSSATGVSLSPAAKNGP